MKHFIESGENRKSRRVAPGSSSSGHLATSETCGTCRCKCCLEICKSLPHQAPHENLGIQPETSNMSTASTTPVDPSASKTSTTSGRSGRVPSVIGSSPNLPPPPPPPPPHSKSTKKPTSSKTGPTGPSSAPPGLMTELEAKLAKIKEEKEASAKAGTLPPAASAQKPSSIKRALPTLPKPASASSKKSTASSKNSVGLPPSTLQKPALPGQTLPKPGTATLPAKPSTGNADAAPALHAGAGGGTFSTFPTPRPPGLLPAAGGPSPGKPSLPGPSGHAAGALPPPPGAASGK